MVLGVYKVHHSEEHAPPPGMSGIHHDKDNKVLHVHYGSDDLPEHMINLQENHEKYPHNRNRNYSVPQEKDPKAKNRKKAMKDSGLETEEGKVRDEKPPNFVRHDGKSVTVRYVPEEESSKYFLERTQYCMNQIEYQKESQPCWPRPPIKHAEQKGGPKSNFMLTPRRVGRGLLIIMDLQRQLLDLQHQLLGLQRPLQPCVLERSLNFTVAP